MQVVSSIDAIPQEVLGAVLVIGNFDGVHIGHQAIIEAARRIAGELGKPCALITFEPHPRKLFRPDDPPFRITPPTLKRQRLELAGVEWLIELTFDWDFASQSPAEFIDRFLSNGLQPSHVVVGRDFCFGQLREGTSQSLVDAGYEVTIIEKVESSDGDDLSCSTIRQALQQGDLARANSLLGWQWEMTGEVQRGEQRGRTLGYPTANVPLGDVLHPAYGVYAAWVKVVSDGEDAPWMASATNIGIRPMFEIPVGQIESFIFDFDRDIYGRLLRIRPVQRLRGEAKLESLDALVRQMGKDCQQARTILGT